MKIYASVLLLTIFAMAASGAVEAQSRVNPGARVPTVKGMSIKSREPAPPTPIVCTQIGSNVWSCQTCYEDEEAGMSLCDVTIERDDDAPQL